MKRKSVRNSLGILLAAVLILVFATALAAPLTGSRLKDCRISTFDDQTCTLYELLEEKDMVILDFWYADCPGCPESMKAIQRIAEESGGRIAAIGLNSRSSDTTEEIQSFIDRNKLTLPMARDTAGLAKALRVKGYPHTAIILKGGIVLLSDNMQEPQKAVELGLQMTEQDLLDLAEWNKTYKGEKEEPAQIANYATMEDDQGGDAARRAWIDRQSYYYASRDAITMDLEGENVRKIVVEDNVASLEAWQRVGQFYLVEDGGESTLRVELGRGANVKNAYTDGDGLPDFSSAERDGKAYLFKTNFIPGAKYFVYPGDRNNFGAGLITFASEEDAADYFRVMEKVSGYRFPWHIEEKQAE